MSACGDDDDDSEGNAGAGGSDRDGGAGSGGSGGSNAGAGGTMGGAGGTMGGAGGTGGTGGSLDEDGGVVDEDAGMEPLITASASITGVDDNDLYGTVTFTADEADVSAYIELDDCPDGNYQMHIHEGEDCTNYGPHWDPPRGEGIPNITCDSEHGELTYVRRGTDDKPWSVDLGAEDTDVNGHTFVVHDAGGTVVACGAISVD